MTRRIDDARGLLELPSEVIHGIAVHCDGDSALALSSTSKALHEICYSWLVFRAIVTSKLYNVSPVQGVSLENIDTDNHFRFSVLAKLLGRNTDAWARYAVAISRAIALEERLRVLSTDGDDAYPFSLQPPQLAQYLSYMPQLLCLGYTPRQPVTIAIDSFREICRSTLGEQNFDWRSIEPGNIDWRYKDHNGCEEVMDAPALKFCFLAEVMRGEVGGRYAWRELLDGVGTGRIFRSISLRRIMEKLTRTTDPCDVVACLSFNLRLSSGEPHPFFRPRHMPPLLHQFPLLYSEPNFCGPLQFAPFSRNTNWLFLLPHTTENETQPLAYCPELRTKPSSSDFIKPYIEAGEWCGYYRFGPSITDTLTPLHGIKFVLEASKTAMHFVAVGRGMIGPNPCELRGWINLGGGQNSFSLRLVRLNGAIGHPDYPISGQLTPFGLTGDMSLDAITVAKIWLWNAAWSAGDQE